MKFIGFNFNKISAEKFLNNFENAKVKTNINILEIKEVKSDLLKSKEDIINVEFVYDIDYSPKIARIEFSGSVILTENPKTIKEILKEWKKKQIPEDFKINLFNFILRKSNTKALQLEDDINIPLHIPLPFLKKDKE